MAIDQVGGAGRPSRVLDASLLSFDLHKELGQLKSEEAWQRERRNAITLMKGPRLRVVLVAMQAGAQMHTPHADGPLSVLPLSGRIALQAAGQRQEARSGHVLTLEHAVEFAIEAMEESAFVLTLAFEGHNAGQPGHGRS